MDRLKKTLPVLMVIALVTSITAVVYAENEAKLTGMVVGRTGEVLHVSLPQPVREGTVLSIKTLESQDAIAEARVLSCTQERPFIALAKVTRGDIETLVPVGVHAYADIASISGTDAPKPMEPATQGDSSARLSLQAGTFYPSSPTLRKATGNYWQSYRLSYAPFRTDTIDILLSTEYMKGTGSYLDNSVANKTTMEVVPITAVARTEPLKFRNAHLYLGAGAGLYHVSSKQTVGDISSATSSQKVGTEYLVGIESKHGWVLEMRYRDVKDTDIQGYLLSLGGRF